MSGFSNFEKLTSVHVNSTDDHMLASGYTFGVRLFDLGTGQVRGMTLWCIERALNLVGPLPKESEVLIIRVERRSCCGPKLFGLAACSVGEGERTYSCRSFPNSD